MKELNILHLDMDAFYASVEEQDNPKLKGKPVIVGGKSKHGIVTTANYEARKYGVKSAMPIFMARKLCPKGYFLPVRMHRYKEVSNKILRILYDITDLVEQVSIDEAYLDISNIDMEPLKLARKIRKNILSKTGLTLSIGISYNKFLAKLASEWNKPNGTMIITKDMVPKILLPLPVKSIHGIGPKSAKKLNNIGIYTVKDLYGLSENFLTELFGKSGLDIYLKIRGVDNRGIETARKRKSLGTETTFENDTKDINVLYSYLREFAIEISRSLKIKRLHGRTVTVKVKFDDFRIQTKSKTLPHDIISAKDIYKVGVSLLKKIPIRQNIRLIGLTVSNLNPLDSEQLSLFD